MVVFDSAKWIVPVTVVIVVTVGVAGTLVYSVRRASQEPVPTKTSQTSSLPSQSAAETIPSSDATSIAPSTSPLTSAATGSSQITSSNSKKTQTACTSIEKLLSTFEQTTPTWEQLGCHFASVTRLPTPAYFTKMNVDYDAHRGDRTSLVTIYQDLWDVYMREYGLNVSPANGAGMPPYAGGDGQPMSYPLSTENFDAKMRGVAVAYLGEKAKGRRINFQNFHPPDQIAPVFGSGDAFRTWIREQWLPQKQTEADVAEKLKAEYYVPFPIEIEIFFNPISQPQLAQLSGSEQVTLAQEWVDQTLATVRPVFGGRLQIQLAANYASYPFWQNLRTTGFDQIAATLLPSCDVATSASYIQTQLAGYSAIAQRDGVPWGIGELGFFEKYFQACGHAKAEFEKELYETAFRLLDSSDPQPIGLSIDETSPTADAKQVIVEYFKSHS